MLKQLFLKLKNHPTKWLRTSAGVLLIIMGLLGFLPVLGFWMIPLGVILLSVDFRWMRRLRRRAEAWWGNLRKRKAKPENHPTKRP